MGALDCMRLLVSVLFWLGLFAAAFLFGSAVLAPSYAQWHRTREELVLEQRSLVALEQEVRWLRRAVAAQSDQQRDTPTIEGEHIAVPIPAAEQPKGPPEQSPAHALPLHARWLLFVAAHPRLQSRFLLAAALLVLTGFTVLNDSGPADPADLPLLRRYWRPAPLSHAPPDQQPDSG